jgi:selenide,water dikinase
LHLQKFDNVLVGTELFDDAGVVKISDDLAIVTTVDYFTPVVDDAFDFGAIAAANSLSDLYAMGAKAIAAINIVGFPEKNIPYSVLKKIIEGGLSVAKEAGIPIVGGHTVKSPEPFYGLSITGSVEPDRILTNSSAQIGDHLYLTKPLGTGLITTGLKNGKAIPEMVANAVAIMKELNRSASEAVRAVTDNEQPYNCAVTDITGYGLLGHLSEMLLASKKSAEIDYSKVPLMPGTVELARQDQFPGGSRSNLLNVEPDMLWSGEFEKYERLILADAQTSGGLLISVRPDLAGALESELKKRDVKFARIGDIVERAEWQIKVARS